MTRLSLALLTAAVAGLVACATPVASADKVSIMLPEDHDSYKDGPNADAARTYCGICHAPDYVYLQPPLTRAQWEAEVKKMKTVFGAPYGDDMIKPLTDYLMSQNGKGE
jgi:hypothetical protein